jgi:hypothetical protein
MKRLLPSRVEVLIFAIVALVCAGVVYVYGTLDLGLSAMSIPVFIGAAMMGMRKNGQLGERQVRD